MTRIARMNSNIANAHDSRIQTTKIHLATPNGMAGSILLPHLLKARRLTAVNVSATYVATPIRASTHSQPYDVPSQHDFERKSESV